MRIALYVRNSTNEERQNPETQLRPLRERCKREGWDFEVFQEFASGAKESRPELNRMLEQIRAKRFGAVMVWRLDRLGRSLKHLLQLIEEFKKKDVKFFSLTEGFDTTTPQGELFFGIAGAFAQFERKLIQERVNVGVDGVADRLHRAIAEDHVERRGVRPAESACTGKPFLVLHGIVRLG